MSERIPMTAAILAGGSSSRMGVNKTRIPVGDKTMLEAVVESMTPIAANVMVVFGNADDRGAFEFGDAVRIVADELPGQGPLGGIEAALAASTDEWVLVIAADMPSISADVVRLLWDRRGDADAVVPVTMAGPEPLFALYSKRVLPHVRKALEYGGRRPVALLAIVNATTVDEEALREVDPELATFANVNTPADAAGLLGRPLPAERPVTILMNDTEIGTVQASPRDLDELAVGFLVAEGLLTQRSALRGVVVDEEERIYITSDEAVPDDMFFRERHVTSGCGKGFTFVTVGHARGLAPVGEGPQVDKATVLALMRDLDAAAAEHRRTGGVHTCALARDGELVLVREDVGRHNAFDKILGRAWLDGIDTAHAVLLSTGRISYEMAVKAAKAAVPIVVSRSAATDLAAEIAEELGITLVAYARGRDLLVCTHPERVSGVGL